MDMEYKDAPGEVPSTPDLNSHSWNSMGSIRPKKPNEIPQPGKEPETTPEVEPEPNMWPRKEPEIQPGKEPLTAPPDAPLEVPNAPENTIRKQRPAFPGIGFSAFQIYA